MKKIVLIYLGRRGAGPEYAFEMAKALSKKANLLCVISKYASNYENWRTFESTHPLFSVMSVPTYNTKTEFVLRSLNIFQYKKVVEKINAFGADVIYSPMGHLWERLIVPYCKSKIKIRTIHDVILHKGEDSFIHKIYSYLTSYKTNKVVILSKTFKPILLAEGYKAEDIMVIPHAVFTGYTSPGREKNYQFYNRILFFGRIIEYKGIGVLLNAMQYVLEKCPNLKLSITGSGDIEPYKYLVEKYRDNLELHVGWIEDSDVYRYFSNIDLVVIPYTQASQSGVIPLSYSFGKPVIATNVGGIPEQVLQGETGYLVEPKDVLSLANAITDVMNDHDKLTQMKRNSYQVAAKNSWDESADLFLSYLNI